MKPQDIDKIASVVVESLSGAPGLLGCGSFTNRQRYDGPQGECEVNYQCGGLGEFYCCYGFDCIAGFACPGNAAYACRNDEMFHCLAIFTCDQNFTGTLTFCPPPLPGK